jgi:hypothetical protein
MISLYKYVIGFCIHFVPARDLFKKKIDIQISCYENILTCNLSWLERQNTFYKLSDLYYYKFMLDNVQDIHNITILDPDLAYENGSWFIEEDF